MLGMHGNVNEGVRTLRALRSRSACNVGAEGSKVRPFPLTVCGSRSSGNGAGEQNLPHASVKAIARCTQIGVIFAKRSEGGRTILG